MIVYSIYFIDVFECEKCPFRPFSGGQLIMLQALRT